MEKLKIEKKAFQVVQITYLGYPPAVRTRTLAYRINYNSLKSPQRMFHKSSIDTP